MILMPKGLTAENGAKAALLGQFREWLPEQECPECEGDGLGPACPHAEGESRCEMCGGTGEVSGHILVSWANIKAIYRGAVDLLGEPVPAPRRLTRWQHLKAAIFGEVP